MKSHPHFLWADLFRRKKAEKAHITDVLKENVLFRTLRAKELQYVTNVVYERVYQPGEPIFQQNDRGLGMYVIVQGRVAIKTQAAEGECHVTSLTDGSFFGEIALIDPGNIRSASAIAEERTTLAGFFKPDLMEILERKPAMGVKILFQLSTVLGRRLTETTEKITQLKKFKEAPKTDEQGHEPK
jgi:CRP/FNR family cyclic AMP-dependent transcriptional regulator